MRDLIVDLFAGPGGWDEAARTLQLPGTLIGIEHDPLVCRTRALAGHKTIRADVAHVATEPFEQKTRILLASPPCQPFSVAGKKRGWEDVTRIEEHAKRCVSGWVPYPNDGWHDPNAPLVLEILRWALLLEPEWVFCEQVPRVLEFYELVAEIFEQRGWAAWTGQLNAADFGVAQTRRRAFLIASRTKTPIVPTPTHTETTQPYLLGGLLPWVSVEQKLGCPSGKFGFPRKNDRGSTPDGYRARDWRPTSAPAFALTEKARSWQLHAATEQRQFTINEALLLQSFRPDYPVAGPRTRQFEQVANAVPPLLATHLLQQAH